MKKSQQLHGLCVCYEGTEQCTVDEVKSLIGAESTCVQAAVTFPISKREDLFTLAYRGQSFSRVIELLFSFPCTSLDDLSALSRFDFSFLDGKRFRVTCLRLGNHSFSSPDVEQDVGALVLGKVKTQVDMHDPEIILFVYIYDKVAYIGIDYVGFDLSKRDYNVYPHRSSIKGPLAYALLYFAGYRKNGAQEKSLLDPLCLSGTIALEAGFIATGFPINYFRKNKFFFVKRGLVDDAFFSALDSPIPTKQGAITGVDYNLPNITASKHNAKLAGLEKVIDFRRGDMRWIDLKFDPLSFDCVIMSPPIPAGRSRALLQRRLDELFQNLAAVMKKNAVLVLLDNGIVRSLAERYGFVLEKEYVIRKSKVELKVLAYGKKVSVKKE